MTHAAIYAIMALWSLGCFFLPLVAGYILIRDKFSRWEGVFVICVAWPVGCALAVLPWIMAADTKSPDLAVLKKNEWQCTVRHTQTVTTYVQSGKIMVPITNVLRVCDQYSRKGNHP